MRWKIRKANIGTELRTSLEQHGAPVVRQIVADNMSSARAVFYGGWDKRETLAWLTEQNDREERKETWSLTMEAAITIFVFTEIILTLFYGKCS
jgi:hypothetical protein